MRKKVRNAKHSRRTEDGKPYSLSTGHNLCVPAHTVGKLVHVAYQVGKYDASTSWWYIQMHIKSLEPT